MPPRPPRFTYLPHTHIHMFSPRSAPAKAVNNLDVFVCVCVCVWYLAATLTVSSIELPQMDLQMHYIITSGLHREPFTWQTRFSSQISYTLPFVLLISAWEPLILGSVKSVAEVTLIYAKGFILWAFCGSLVCGRVCGLYVGDVMHVYIHTHIHTCTPRWHGHRH